MHLLRKTRSTASTRPAAPDRILRAAEGMFSERGYDGVSINAIARRAGVSKANVFHHFASKSALYLAVVRRACDACGTQVQRLGAEPLPAAERLTRFAQQHLANMFEQQQVMRLVLRELLKNPARRGEELARQVIGEHFARLVEIVRQGQRAGELRAEIDPAMVAVLLVSANVHFFQSRDVLRHLPGADFAQDPARYSAQAVDILLRGILKPKVRKRSKTSDAD